MNLKEFIRDYLAFSRKERIGITVIIILLFMIFLFPFLTDYKKRKKEIKTDSSWVNAIRKLEQKNTDTVNRHPAEKLYPDDGNRGYFHDQNKGNTVPSLFYFDPNTIPLEAWKKLGVHGRTATTIQKYLSKGGVFRKAEDLQKVYGLTKEDYDRLAPYIKIEHAIADYPEKEFTAGKNNGATIAGPSHYKVIDINTADTAGFISLPGIGRTLAMRIISFRDKLGGFYSIEQVKETYGITDSVFQKVKQYLVNENTAIRKININIATKDELKVHPYIKWDIANAIVEYRNQHGPFSAIGDLKKIQAINNDIFNRIISYLAL